MDDGRFDGLDGEQTGNVVDKAVKREEAFLLEKELGGLFVALLVKPGPDTAFLYEYVMLRSFPFMEQDSFCGRFHPALEGEVFFPIGVELRELIPEMKKHVLKLQNISFSVKKPQQIVQAVRGVHHLRGSEGLIGDLSGPFAHDLFKAFDGVGNCFMGLQA